MLVADKQTNNNEGIYFVYSKLAQIYEQTDKTACFSYLTKALASAKQLKDNLYIASAHLEIGDYYYRERELIPALKSFLSAKEFMRNSKDEENEAKIETRLNDLKIKMGERMYNAILESFNGKNE